VALVLVVRDTGGQTVVLFIECGFFTILHGSELCQKCPLVLSVELSEVAWKCKASYAISIN
jgi:hypothetical protein